MQRLSELVTPSEFLRVSENRKPEKKLKEQDPFSLFSENPGMIMR